MGITCHRGRYYWVKRVPRDLADVVLGAEGQRITQVRVALRTDSRREAMRRAPAVEAEKLAEWQALGEGKSGTARAHYQASKRLAESNGYPYIPSADLVRGEIADLLARLAAVARPDGPPEMSQARALLGTVPPALPGLWEVLDEFVELTQTRHLQKTEAQKKRWLLPRQRAIRNFLNVTRGTDMARPKDLPVNEITRSQAIAFRKWWSQRIAEGHKVETANKDFTHLSQLLSTWSKFTGNDVENPFKGLRLEGMDGGTTPPFSRAWVAERLIAPGALDRLNPEAADVLLVMVNTGARPSEIIDAPLQDFVLDANIPFLRIAANGRQLKVPHTARELPLLGVSLEAARRIVERGGCVRYRNKSASWSAVTNKFLETNGLKETPRHVAYSLRHYVEDALLAAGVDDRIRADILGHKYQRPNYGEGGGLQGRGDALSRIAL